MRRIIAYIYRYSEDKENTGKSGEEFFIKCGNAGFCRVEECGDKHTITICFKETFALNEKCDIYPLTRDGGMYSVGQYGIMRQILCGQMNTRMETGKCHGLLMESGIYRYIVLWGKPEELVCVRRAVKADSPEERVEADIPKPQVACERTVESEPEMQREVKSEARVFEKREESMLDRAFNRLCKVRMVIEDRECQAVKMRPQDMIMLPRTHWRLANNCFLMDGYYRKKHILFFRNNGIYVIGVPGRGGADEEKYAKRFGFQRRVTGWEYGRNNDRRIYWLMDLE